ncbi:TetR/AcrR family transcriptional regulator [Dictyobacter kobayashii]|uniref:TetR family transcriptional regulator n=1 Tax=Dictyobacter kobayashii TaxID=2014872 RepID=A0A402ATU1_9CHLR|nr:TetR/AcrR family transcriptional regulator [Dictyobacter kobayashii]GCE22479.1 TetR family transcriptional regulator [Dictyobacter kobayashii]
MEERRDAAEHRQRILQTARRLFAEQGVDQVGMYQIARAAQVGQGTLYRRFAHKGILCQALLEESCVNLQTTILSYLEQTDSEGVPVFEQINYLLLQLITYTEENAPLLGAMLDASSGDRRTQSYHSPFYLWMRELFLVLLTRGVMRHELPEQDLDYVVDVMLAPLDIDFYHYQRHERGFSQQRIAANLRQFLAHGLNPNP